MSYHLIPFSHLHPEEKNRRNQALINWVSEHQQPVAWLNGWKPGCVNVGATQNIALVVDKAEAARQGLVVVQRQGGGGTMYLSEEGEVSWAIIVPETQLPQEITDIYTEVCGRVVTALARLGVSASHKSINDIITKHGKISGATARKTKGVVYVGGTLLWKVNRESVWRVLYPLGMDDKGRDKKILQLTSVFEECGASKQDTINALINALTKQTYTLTTYEALMNTAK